MLFTDPVIDVDVSTTTTTYTYTADTDSRQLVYRCINSDIVQITLITYQRLNCFYKNGCLHPPQNPFIDTTNELIRYTHYIAYVNSMFLMLVCRLGCLCYEINSKQQEQQQHLWIIQWLGAIIVSVIVAFCVAAIMSLCLYWR